MCRDGENPEGVIVVVALLVFSPEKLRAAREAAGLPRDRAAVHAGLSIATLQGWEAGRSVPDSRLLANLCALLGVSMDSLFVSLEEAAT
jgi:transcriptional regulator with XRE-family HTH domain